MHMYALWLTLTFRKQVLSRVYLTALVMYTLEWEVYSAITVKRRHAYLRVCRAESKMGFHLRTGQAQPPRLRPPVSLDSRHKMVTRL
jgi:hypothetical protein